MRVSLLISALAAAAVVSAAPEVKKPGIPERNIGPSGNEMGGPVTSDLQRVRTGREPPHSTLPTIGSYRTFGYVSGGYAVENETWTFDHGGAPHEGWTTQDLTADNFVAGRRVTDASWAGHNNMVLAPVLNGSGSMWLGLYEDEADLACFRAGLGYGNDWHQRFLSPLFNHTGANMVSISFNYFLNAENFYDYLHVIVLSAGGTVRDTVASLTGVDGNSAAPENFNQSVLVGATTFRVLLEFDSDFSWSDEDSLYLTSEGPFGFDDFDITSPTLVPLGVAPPYNFDSGTDGWTAEAFPGVGTFAAVANSGGYTITDPTCNISGNGVVFHDGSVEHPAGQVERYTSPPVPVGAYGANDINVFAEYDIYADLPPSDDVRFTWKFSYYPYFCPYTGEDIWSEPVGPNINFYAAPALCSRFRSFANDTTGPSIASTGALTIPGDADFVRFHFEVISTSSMASGNFTPMIDNVRVGVSLANTVLHVPSPSYPTIQSAIDAADPGDTVFVAPGTYTGEGNRDLSFGGKNIVLMSEEGAGATIIDCENAARGFHFNSVETSASIVDGFKIINGWDQIPGTAIRVGPDNSSPTIRNCIFQNNNAQVGAATGVVLVENGSPTFEDCVASSNFSDGFNGIFTVVGGSPTFTGCIITNNTINGFGVLLTTSTPTFASCEISDNLGPTAVYVGTGAVIDGCEISVNSGDGLYLPSLAAPSMITNTNITGNGGAGAIIEGNSSAFLNCKFSGNMGSGIIFTGVTAAYRTDLDDEDRAFFVREPDPNVTLATTTSFDSCIISGNVNTSASGGGIRFDCSNNPSTQFEPIWNACIITGNSSAVSGGGAYICGNAVFAGIAPRFYSCTFSANSAAEDGGAIHLDVTPAGDIGSIELIQTILYGNCSGGSGQAVYAELENFVDIDCSIFTTLEMDGAGNFIYGPSNVEGGDPGFCEPEPCSEEGTIGGDFGVADTSQALPENNVCSEQIGAGNMACSSPTGITPVDGDIPAETSLLPNEPNPFNPTTRIRFDVAESGPVILRIYDVKGRLVRTLVNEVLNPAPHITVWDGRDDYGSQVASGVYFMRLVAGSVVDTRKMVLLK